MEIKIIPYIAFPGNCRDAMTFYSECLEAQLQIMTIGESPIAGDFPGHQHHLVLHSTLYKEDTTLLMAADHLGDEELSRGNSMSMLIDCQTENELRELFARLSADGLVLDAPEEKFWGGIYGMCRDKFGTEWGLNCDKSGLQSVAADSFDGL